MASRFQELINGRLGIGAAMAFSQIVPKSLGYRIGNFIVDRISSRKNLEMVQAARLNQWVVGGENLNSEEVDVVVRRTYRNTAHTLFDVYRTLNDPAGMGELVAVNETFKALVSESVAKGTGSIIVGAHLNQVDLLGLYAGYLGARPLVLAYPNPGAGYQWQNDIRESFGIELYPTNRAAMKKALTYLKGGGTVATAADRPLPSSNLKPLFFGRRASLPLHYIMLALKADLPIVVATPLLRDDGKYEVKVSEPIYTEKFQERKKTMLYNAEKVLEVVEERILEVPHQWTMYYPVWPALMDKVPTS